MPVILIKTILNARLSYCTCNSITSYSNQC